MGYQEKLGKNLLKARKKSGFTQLVLAEKVGIHVNYYAKIERGEVKSSLDTLEAIFKALKVKSSDIIPF